MCLVLPGKTYICNTPAIDLSETQRKYYLSLYNQQRILANQKKLAKKKALMIDSSNMPNDINNMLKYESNNINNNNDIDIINDDNCNNNNNNDNIKINPKNQSNNNLNDNTKNNNNNPKKLAYKPIVSEQKMIKNKKNDEIMTLLYKNDNKNLYFGNKCKIGYHSQLSHGCKCVVIFERESVLPCYAMDLNHLKPGIHKLNTIIDYLETQFNYFVNNYNEIKFNKNENIETVAVKTGNDTDSDSDNDNEIIDAEIPQIVGNFGTHTNTNENQQTSNTNTTNNCVLQ